MKNFLQLKGTKSSRKVTFILLAIFCASMIAVFFTGLSGNWYELSLCYLAAIALILAFVHTWRRVKYFLILLGASLIGFPFFAVAKAPSLKCTLIVSASKYFSNLIIN